MVLNGQSSIEYLAIVGLGLLLATPFIGLVQEDVVNLRTDSQDARFTTSLDEMESAIERANALGEPAQTSFTLEVPDNIQSARVVGDKNIVFNQNRSGDVKNYTRIMDVEISALRLPTETGSYRIKAIAWNNQINLSSEDLLFENYYFRPSVSTFDSTVPRGEQFNASYNVENLARSQGEQQVSVKVENSTYSDTLRTENLQLDARETDSTDVLWSSSGKALGEYEFTVETENETIKRDFMLVSSSEFSKQGLVGHWDATDLDQVYSDGDTVSSWPEKVSNNNATAPTTSEAPSFSVNGIKGNPALSFDGGDVLTVNHSTEFDLNDFTVVTLFKADSASLTENIGTINNKQTADKFDDRGWWIALDNGNGFAGGNGALGLRTSSSGSELSLEASDKNYIDDTPYLSVALVNSTADQASFRVESDEKDSATSVGPPEGSGAPIGFGAEISGSIDSGFDRFFAGELGEILIYNRSLQPDELNDLETYLDEKWGLSTVIQESDFRIATQSSNSPIIEGENITVSYNISNNGNTQDTQTVSLVIENQSGIKFTETRSHTLVPGSNTGTQNFEIQTAEGDSGLYDYMIQTENETVDSQLEIIETLTTNGLHAHWDMSNLSYSNGATVTSVSDSTGNGYDLTNSGTGPVMVENALNGYDLIEFEGNSRLDSPQWSAISEPYTVFMVTSSYDTPSDGVTMDTAGGAGRAFMARDNPEWRIWNGGGLNTGFAGDEQEHIITAVYSDSSGKFRYDGSEESGASGSNSITSIRLGQDQTGTRALEGRIGEVMLYDSALSQTEIDQVEAYLSGKWGIATS